VRPAVELLKISMSTGGVQRPPSEKEGKSFDDDFEMISDETASTKTAVEPPALAPINLFDTTIQSTSEDLGPKKMIINLAPPPRIQQAPKSDKLPIPLYPGFRCSIFSIIKVSGQMSFPSCVRINGKVMGSPVTLEIPVTPITLEGRAATHLTDVKVKLLHSLAARALIQDWEDKEKTEKHRAEIERLGKRYSLASSATSFLAIDGENKKEIEKGEGHYQEPERQVDEIRVHQVSNDAVGSWDIQMRLSASSSSGYSSSSLESRSQAFGVAANGGQDLERRYHSRLGSDPFTRGDSRVTPSSCVSNSYCLPSSPSPGRRRQARDVGRNDGQDLERHEPVHLLCSGLPTRDAGLPTPVSHVSTSSSIGVHSVPFLGTRRQCRLWSELPTQDAGLPTPVSRVSTSASIGVHSAPLLRPPRQVRLCSNSLAQDSSPSTSALCMSTASFASSDSSPFPELGREEPDAGGNDGQDLERGHRRRSSDLSAQMVGNALPTSAPGSASRPNRPSGSTDGSSGGGFLKRLISRSSAARSISTLSSDSITSTDSSPSLERRRQASDADGNDRRSWKRNSRRRSSGLSAQMAGNALPTSATVPAPGSTSPSKRAPGDTSGSRGGGFLKRLVSRSSAAPAPPTAPARVAVASSASYRRSLPQVHPRQASDPGTLTVESIARAQQFDGSFPVNSDFIRLLTGSSSTPALPGELAVLSGSEQAKQIIWVTVLVLAVLAKKFAKDKDSWEMLAEKSSEFVETSLVLMGVDRGNAVTVTGQLEAAAASNI